jgi:hypothetical protein
MKPNLESHTWTDIAKDKSWRFDLTIYVNREQTKEAFENETLVQLKDTFAADEFILIGTFDELNYLDTFKKCINTPPQGLQVLNKLDEVKKSTDNLIKLAIKVKNGLTGVKEINESEVVKVDDISWLGELLTIIVNQWSLIAQIKQLSTCLNSTGMDDNAKKKMAVAYNPYFGFNISFECSYGFGTVGGFLGNLGLVFP